MTDWRLRSPEELEQDIARTRADIDQNLTVLTDWMSREAIVDWAIQSLNRRGAGFITGMGRAVRDNPVPSLVLGAGFAWLVSASRWPPGGQRRIEPSAASHRDPHRPLGTV